MQRYFGYAYKSDKIKISGIKSIDFYLFIFPFYSTFVGSRVSCVMDTTSFTLRRESCAVRPY